jgi:hypothetical protein
VNPARALPLARGLGALVLAGLLAALLAVTLVPAAGAQEDPATDDPAQEPVIEATPPIDEPAAPLDAGTTDEGFDDGFGDEGFDDGFGGAGFDDGFEDAADEGPLIPIYITSLVLIAGVAGLIWWVQVRKSKPEVPSRR